MFSIETRPISYSILLILSVSSLVTLLLATDYRTFVDEPFEVSCKFPTLENEMAFISIAWYHNSTIDLGTGIFTNNNGIPGSTITINDATFSDSGDYHCVATVGSNSPSNSTSNYITVVVPYAPDVITLNVSSIEYFSAVVSWNGTDMSPPLTETYSILVSRVGSNEEVNLTVPMGNTTLTILDLIPNNEYEVYVEATNRFYTTQGSTTSFSASSLRLYFIHENGDIVPIGAGSIFRGGIHWQINFPVTEFHCFPNRPEQVITWYQPNGDVIPTGSSSGLYSTRDINTGESVFYPNNAISYDNEGDNFTCSFMDISNETMISSLGIYYAKFEHFKSFGNRLYGQDYLIYEFVYQRGIFNFNFTQSYTVECIISSLGGGSWRFIPNLLSTTDITTKDPVLTNVRFDPSSACQFIQCTPTEENVAVSNQPFFIQTVSTSDPVAAVSNRYGPFFIDCFEDNHEFIYTFGDTIHIRITCPLVFGAHFLDVANTLRLQGSFFTDSRRLWFDPTTVATFQLDREFVCEDMYGERVSFRIIVNGIEEIQVLTNASSSVGITNDTNLIGNAEIPDSLLCVTQTNNNAATWYVDSNPNRNTAESVPVTNDTTQMPHVVSPRNGRSDLILDGTIGDGAEGFYSCVTNPQIRLGIFLEMPEPPIVEITGNPQNIQVIITITTLILVCDSTNMPYPNPIYFWTGNVNFNAALLDTAILLEADTGIYTCTGSNVVGFSVDTIIITVIPPPPQFDLIQLVTSLPVFVSDTFTIQCQFSTLINVTSIFSVEWYMNGAIVMETSDISIATSTSAGVCTSELRVTNSLLTQEGNYSCRATVGSSGQTDSDNSVFNFNFPQAPIITIHPVDPITEYITRNVTITCLFTTLDRFQDSLSINWHQNGTMVSTSGNNQISTMNLNATTTESKLTITSLVVDNAGMYHCVGQILDMLNSEKAISDVINIQVIGIPTPIVRIDSVTPITDYITQNVSITCLVTTLDIFQSALKVDWYQNETLVSTGGNIQISRITVNATTESILTITSLMVDNAGMYYCVGQIMALLHSEETMSDVITVDVTGPPAPIVTISPLGTISDYITQNVSITCVLTTLSQFQDNLSIFWYQNETNVNTGGNIQISTIRVNATTESILTIMSLVVDNAGMYYCVGQIMALLHSEETMSNVITVDVTGPPAPIVTISPLGTISDYITQNVSITCVLTTLSQFQAGLMVDWYQNETMVDTSGNIQISTMNLNATTTESTLTITSLVFDNAGMYHCVGQILDILNSEESISDVINIQVIGIPTPIVMIDSVTPITDYITQDVSITCLVTTLDIFQDALNVDWYQNGTLVDTSGNIEISTVNSDATTTESVLTITSLVVDNAGTYYCIAQIMDLSNSEEETSIDIIVIVTGPPAPIVTISPLGTISDYITHNVSITCVLTTLSQFQAGLMVDWYQNETMVDTSGNIQISTMNLSATTTESILTITSLVFDNAGMYHCVGQILDILNSEEAISDVINIQVIGIPTPIVMIDSVTPITDYITQDVSITCLVTTLDIFQDALNVDWYQNGTLVDTSGNIEISTVNSDATTTESVLTITSLVVDNAGTYYCIAQIMDLSNSEEETSIDIIVIVTGPPAPIVTISPLGTISDYITQNVSITCVLTTLSQFQAGLMVDWYQNGNMVGTSGNIEISTVNSDATATESVLTITSLTVDNAGMYYCVGQIMALLHSEKAMSDVITVDVTGPPAPIVTISPLGTISDYITQNVSITCVLTTLSQFQDNLSIFWYQNETNVNTGGNIQISTIRVNATTESILTIMSLVVDNAGMYYCVGQIMALLHSEETMSNVITVDVTGPPAPIVTISPLGTISDYITQNVSITCVLTTLSQFQDNLSIFWYQNETNVNTGGNIQISTIRVNATTESILTIMSLVVDNAGMYYCVGQIMALLHSEETMSTVITVDVIGPPAPIVTISPLGTISDYITQNVSITCVLTTLSQFQDNLSIFWYQNETNVNTGGNIQISTIRVNATTESILTIMSLVVDNAGMYYCVGQIMALLHSEETMSNVITVDVTGPPAPIVTISPLGTISDYITQNVSITCVLTTLSQFQDNLSIFWYQNETNVNTGGNIQISTIRVNATTTESMFTIMSLVVDNAGMYHCVGQIMALLHSEETMSSEITVEVTGPPTPTQNIVTVDSPPHYITQNIRLTCAFDTLAQFQNDLNIDWYQNGRQVTTGNIIRTKNYLDDITTRSENSIVDLVLANAGEYHCVAQIVGILNSGLENSTTITIQPIEPPTPTLGFNRIYREYNFELHQNFTFHLHCNFTTVDVLLSNLEIDWFHNNSKIQISMNVNVQILTVNQGLDTKDSKLTVQEASLNDTGNYSCEGRIGSFQSTRYPDYFIEINPTVEIPDIDVTVSNTDTNSVTLSLNPSQVGVAKIGSETYIIFYRIAGSNDPYQVYDANTDLSFTIADLMPETEYEYIVQTTNGFGSTNSSSSMVSTSAVDATAAPPVAFEAIIGAVIGILVVAIIFVVLLLLLVCWMKRRGKKPKQHGVINQRYVRNVQNTSSSRGLLTKSTGLRTTLADSKLSKSLDEPIEKSTTFRRAAEVQETVLMNPESGAAEPLYEDFSYEGYNVPIGEFSQKVLEYHLANNAEFDRQFSGLRRDFIHDVTTGSNIVNKPKNRFANIIPYEHSRVKLISTPGENFSDYINACYIDGYYKPQSYIASQGPMPNTINDLWRLVWEKNIEHIVALTRVMEALKKKCEQYWPELETNSCTYGPIEVTLKRIDRFTSYDIRMMEIKHQDYPNDTRSVIQFHFVVWPDHGVPIFSSSLLSFINHTKEYHIPGKQEAPLLIHCSAGVGRTGTFIVLDYFIEHLKENDKINVYRMVAQLREARCLMVQTKDQFMFIHDAIQDLITCKDTFISDHEFQPYLENALIRNLKTMTTPFEDKYELIMHTSRIIDPRDTNESSDLANVMKNRYPNFVPFDSHRVTIVPDQDGDKDYINASFVHGYQRHKGFIAAQSPLDFTVYDFWKMITKYRVQLVVMLSEFFEDGREMSAKYWPEEGKEMLVRYLVIRCEKEQVFDHYVRRKIVVSTEQVRT